MLPLLLVALLPMKGSAAPQVVTSIKPLQLIAAAVTDGLGEPAAIWAQGQDPHHVSLRPSERRQLASADLVLWTGPMLEIPLAELVGELDASVVTVQELAGLKLITVDGEADPHVWADTHNARLVGSALVDALGRIDSANAARYAENFRRFDAALTALDGELQEEFTGLQQRNWAVYHHALRYVEAALGLMPPLALADSENNAPGIRTARRVREQMQQLGISCMLAEPGVNHAEVLTLLELPQLRIVDADVMGRGANAGDYISYMRNLAATLRGCLESAQ